MRLCKIFVTLTFLAFCTTTFSQVKCSSKIAEVNVYALNMYDMYYKRVDTNTIIVSSNAKILYSKSKQLGKQLHSFITKEHKDTLSGYGTLDVRVLIEVTYKNKSHKIVALDRMGDYMIYGKPFKKDKELIELIEQYFPEVRWPAKAHE